VQDAVALLSDESANPKLLAGGQSLGPMLNPRLARPGKLIDILHIPELREVSADSRYFSMGATFTHAEIEDGAIEEFSRGLIRRSRHCLSRSSKPRHRRGQLSARRSCRRLGLDHGCDRRHDCDPGTGW